MKQTATNRAMRLRRKLRAVSTRPRLCVSRSNRYVYLQLIDDRQGKTLAGIHEKTVAGETAVARRTAMAAQFAAALKKLKQTKVAFDRGGNRYHGIVAQLAEDLRANGIEF